MDVDDSRTDPDPRLDDIGDAANKIVEKPRYKSWKKKYRKMRMIYDQRTFESEELHKQELKGIETAKRIAIENDRLLDLLLDVNNSPQIPLDRRIDISLDEPNEPADDSDTTQPQHPSKSLRALQATVPYLTEEELVKRGQLPEIEYPNTLPNADPAAKPPSFLTPDDIDNYLFEIDSRIGGPGSNLPTLAPLAHHGKHAADLAPGSAHPHPPANQTTANSSSSSYQLRNPASVYNWLRKNCPQVFLQDAEKDSHANSGDKDGGDGAAANGTTGKRGAKTPASRAAGTRQSKRASAAKNAVPRASSMDMDLMASDEGTPAPAAATGRGGGKRKRVIDDDPGYRPKGGSSRPTKKKRKSEGVVEATPTAAGKRRGGKAKKSEEKIDLEAEAAEAEKEAAARIKTEMDVDGEGEVDAAGEEE